MKKVVVFGGGTGLSCLLSGLKLFPIDVTTIIAVSDNGSSTGVLKKELDIPAVGDVGKVLLSMANVDEEFIDLLSYRFHKSGTTLYNHPVRNILLAALIDLQGNLGIVIPKDFEMSRNQRLTERIRHAQPQNTGRLPMACGIQDHFLGKMADMLGIAQSIPSCIRQRNRMSDPVKQGNTQFLFQLLNLERNGGLRIPQLVSGFCKAAQFCHFYKNLKALDIHKPSANLRFLYFLFLYLRFEL